MIGILVAGFLPNAYKVMVLAACVPLTTEASIQAFATVVSVEFNTILISLVAVTPLTDAVYLYGTAPPDHVPLANVISTFLYLLAFPAKLLF